MMERKQVVDETSTRIMRHELSLRSIWSIIAVGASLWLVVRIWPIILLLLIALVLAGTVSPWISWLERHDVRQSIGLGFVLLAGMMIIVGLGALVIPALITQASALVVSIPGIQDHLADYVAQLPAFAQSAAAIRRVRVEQLVEPFGGYALAIAGDTVEVLVLGFTSVVLAVYLLADHERVKGFAFALMPRRFHLRAARILLDMETVVGGYVRGQALTSVLIGLFVFMLLWLAGTPYPLALAVVAAFADLIPFVGGVLVLVLAVLATLPQGSFPAAVVAGAIVVYLQLEDHVLIPRIYGQRLRLSPLAVLVAFLIGGELLGIIGALLALPVAAGLRVVIEQLRIELPGEQPGETTQRTLDAVAEATYAEQSEGVSARHAAGMATSMAEQGQVSDLVTPRQVDMRGEEQGATGLIRMEDHVMAYTASNTSIIGRRPLTSKENEALVRANFDADSENGPKE